MKNLIIMSMIVAANAAFAINTYPLVDFNQCRALAEQGVVSAQHDLGVMYLNGTGVTKDYVEAIKWFRKAAEQGLAASENNLGVMYLNGTGVAKDYAEAAKWFRKAAEQGVAAAENNLGQMYLNGNGVAKDYAEAIKWFRKAAEQGVAEAENNLGLMHLNGNGVAKDYDEAAKWFRKAAGRGYAIAQNNLYACEMQRQATMHIDKKQVQLAELMVDNLRGAVVHYMMSQMKSRPPNDLKVLINSKADGGSYIDGGAKALIDPWGNEYRIEVNGKRFAIISNGPDGRAGTNDDIRSDRKK